MLKKKKTTASGKLVLVKSVRRTRSHRMKFCVQRGLGALPSTSKRRGKSQRDFLLCGPVCINTGIACACDYRTTVEQYDTGDYYFRYAGEGGASWAPPYVAGVLALGWQINPQLTAVEIKQLLIESAYENEYGERIIYPAAFIKLVEATT